MKEIYSASDFVVPILGQFNDGSVGPFLGTGVFVEFNNMLVTCEHILPEQDTNFCVAIREENTTKNATVELRDSDYDLAVLKVDDYIPPHAVPLESEEKITNNVNVMCYEYGTTTTIRTDSGKKTNLSPATRIGNVTRFRSMEDIYGNAGDCMLELSFAALKGASGAPVMRTSPPFNLWGIVKANVSTELMPAQVENIHDESGQLEEETKFYLPHALAIHVKHVQNLLVRLES